MTYQNGNGVLEDHSSQHSLHTALGCARNRVGEGRSVLDLQEHGNVDTESGNTSDNHKGPEVDIVQEINVGPDITNLTRQENKRTEHKDGKGGVIMKQSPLVVVDSTQGLLDIDTIKGNKSRRANTVEYTSP